MIYSISEILEKADAVATAKEKKEVLREYDSKVLRSVLQYALDPSIKFLLPEGPVAYQKNQLSGIEHLLYSEARLLYLFVELFGDLPRIELFARQRVAGWDVFGNEVEGSIRLPTPREPDKGDSPDLQAINIVTGKQIGRAHV